MDLPRLLRPACNTGPHAMCSPWSPRPAARSTYLYPQRGSKSGLDVLAEAAVHHAFEGFQPAPVEPRSLHALGPYNPTATLPPKVVKKLLSLEFVEMNELRADIWPDDPRGGHTPRRPGKPPVTNIRTWLESYGHMAAVLTSQFQEKAAEFWAYQTTILHAAHAYEGANWVAYDRLYRREMLAKKDLNWSVPNAKLYSEAFTDRAKRHAVPTLSVRGPYGSCLSS